MLKPALHARILAVFTIFTSQARAVIPAASTATLIFPVKIHPVSTNKSVDCVMFVVKGEQLRVEFHSQQ